MSRETFSPEPVPAATSSVTSTMPLQEFKFHFLNEQGVATTIFRRNGSFDGAILRLDDVIIPIDTVQSTDVQDNRLVIVSATQPPVHLLQMRSAADLKNNIDRSASAYQAAEMRSRMESEGRLSEFRSALCGFCNATVNLTGFAESPQVYCDCCDAIQTVSMQSPVPKENDYNLCDECGMYSRPTKFTSFYFYFLFVVYGWFSDTRYCCPTCSRGTAWKMVFVNAIFLLGFPYSVYQLIRSYMADSLSGPMAGLHASNVAARNGNFAKALLGYERILERVPVAAGLHFNLAWTLAQSGQMEQAIAAADASLADCSNYHPAAMLQLSLYQSLGNQIEVQRLAKQWGMEEFLQQQQQQNVVA
ncbi:MAG: hypothetical protein AAFP90_10095 [Planctomycetota bacterium]